MPSFDIVSEVDSHELTNAIDIANRELKNRFDFKNVEASFTLEKFVVTLQAPSDFQVQQMLDILKARLIARGIDARCMDIGEPEMNLATAKQKVTLKSGIEQKTAKKIAAALKEVRRTNPTRAVQVGGVEWNQVYTLKDLRLPADDRHLIVHIHYYAPFHFTHQGA